MGLIVVLFLLLLLLEFLSALFPGGDDDSRSEVVALSALVEPTDSMLFSYTRARRT